jgi:hypothetical protein
MTVALRRGRRRVDLAQLGDAAHLGRARLDEVHRPGIQQAAEVQQGRHVLTRGDRDPAGAAQLRKAVVVLQGDIHRGQGVRERPPAPEDGQLGLDLAHQRTYPGGVAAHAQRRDHRVDRPLRHRHPVNPKDSPHPARPWSVVTLTSSESTACRPAGPQAEAADLLPGLNGMRSANVSTLVMIIGFNPERSAGRRPGSGSRG